MARSPEEALRLAVGSEETSGTVWWVCPVSAIVHSRADDRLDLEAATRKLFRLPNQYHTVFTMRQIRRGEEGRE
jgi:hypothetical protein